MFKKLLIANRGEIALRILRACNELDIKTVAVHSTADADSLHVKFADESVCIGPPESSRSYLHIPSIMSAVEIAGADAVHPGYGFLAENAAFAEICERCNVAFVGPAHGQIDAMGNKWRAREIAASAGVPTIPGGVPAEQTWKAALELAVSIGLPVVLKAAAGGGGKGIKIVQDVDNFEDSFWTLRAEASAAFGIGDCYVEKYLGGSRHVEVQILADAHGNMIHLGERECSVQRRFQKMIEETPSPAISSELRETMGEAALKLASAVGYRNAGTVEFLVDDEQQFYFLEMNTRIQVEHPITEMVSGVDLVKEQIRIAANIPLRFKQEDVAPRGHAIECRITAEDSATMLPSTGRILNVHVPGGNGIRVDSSVYAGYTVTPFYDSLLAKLIVHASDRHEALAKMRRALNEMQIEGISTSLELHRAILEDEEFLQGNLTTNFLNRFLRK